VLPDRPLGTTLVTFKAVGFISEAAQEMIKLLGVGETYDMVVVADDYNAVSVGG